MSRFRHGCLLCRRQQRVQHLDRRLEHLDEFENALVGPGSSRPNSYGRPDHSGQHLKLASIDLADQRGRVLAVFVDGLGLRDAYPPQPRRLDSGNAERVRYRRRL
jgi:hypothetical protein